VTGTDVIWASILRAQDLSKQHHYAVTLPLATDDGGPARAKLMLAYNAGAAAHQLPDRTPGATARVSMA